ncbi:MAG: hypothetical protein AAF515_02340 [Pseudomonadota bacterium]
MFVSVEFGGSSGHSGVLLTGLGPKSCFLHLTGTSYPKKPYAVHGSATGDAPQLTRDLTCRTLIPSVEDGNKYGISELKALEYWRYYKAKTYTHKEHGRVWRESGRQQALNHKYSNYNHNCALFANRLLLAAMIDTQIEDPTCFKALISTPRWFINRSRKVRDQVLGRTNDEVIYGYRLENLHNETMRETYSSKDNLYDGAAEPVSDHQSGRVLPDVYGALEKYSLPGHRAREVQGLLQRPLPEALQALESESRKDIQEGLPLQTKGVMRQALQDLHPKYHNTRKDESWREHKHKFQANPTERPGLIKRSAEDAQNLDITKLETIIKSYESKLLDTFLQDNRL